MPRPHHRGLFQKGHTASKGRGRPPGSPDKILRGLKQVIADLATKRAEEVASIFARAFAIASAAPPVIPKLTDAQLARLPAAVREHLAKLEAALAATMDRVSAPAELKAAYPYVELALRYNLGRPPDAPFDPGERRFGFYFLTGMPGPQGRDPVRESQGVIDHPPQPATARAALTAGAPTGAPLVPAPPVEGPDDLVPPE